MADIPTVKTTGEQSCDCVRRGKLLEAANGDSLQMGVQVGNQLSLPALGLGWLLFMCLSEALSWPAPGIVASLLLVPMTASLGP